MRINLKNIMGAGTIAMIAMFSSAEAKACDRPVYDPCKPKQVHVAPKKFVVKSFVRAVPQNVERKAPKNHSRHRAEKHTNYAKPERAKWCGWMAKAMRGVDRSANTCR